MKTLRTALILVSLAALVSSCSWYERIKGNLTIGRDRSMSEAFQKLSNMEGKDIAFDKVTLPADDRVDLPPNIESTALRKFVESYLDLHHWVLIQRDNKLIVTTTEAYEKLWLHDIAAAEAKAKAEKKPLLVKFEADWCHPCHDQDKLFNTDEELNAVLQQFVLLKVDGNQLDTPDGEARPEHAFAKKLGLPDGFGFPMVVLVSVDGQTKSLEGFTNDPGFYIDKFKLFQIHPNL